MHAHGNRDAASPRPPSCYRRAPMFGWLKRRAPRSPPRRSRSTEELLAAIDAALDDSEWGPSSQRSLCQALYEGTSRGAGAELLARLSAGLPRWYERHPLAIAWGRSHDFAVIDPLGITTEESIPSSEEPELAPWATTLRTFDIVTGGANVFHHGIDGSGLLALLDDPHAPARIENLPLPWLVDETPAQVNALVDRLCSRERFEPLRHLAVSTGLTLTAGHFERLAQAPWAKSLQTLDLTETMVDWSVDCPAELRRALRTLSRFESLTHLFLYNDLGTTDDAAALLEAPLPALTHLDLGGGPTDDGFLELLATTKSLPKLEELCLSGGPERTSKAWDVAVELPFAVFLHGQRVTAQYPKRSP